MDLFQLKLFQRMSERMGWLGARQEVLAQNIANSDTPDFVPHDMKALKFVDHLDQVAPIAQARTNAMHLGGTSPTRRSTGRRPSNMRRRQSAMPWCWKADGDWPTPSTPAAHDQSLSQRVDLSNGAGPRLVAHWRVVRR
jgi:hypothetical protein